MFCPKCGTQVPDNAQFCSNCQAPLSQQPAPQQPVQAQPQPVQPVQSPVVPVQSQPAAPVATMPSKPVKRGNVISNLFDSRFRMLALIALVVWLAAMGITVGSYFIASDTVLDELPAVTYIASATGEELDLDDEDLEETRKELEKAIETLDEDLEELDAEDRETIKDLANATLAFLEDQNMTNLREIIDQLDQSADVIEKYEERYSDELSEENREELDELMESVEEIQEYVPMLDAISMVFLGFMIFCLLFTFFGGLFKLNGLVITGMIFTILYTFLFAGILWLALAVLTHAGMITMNVLLKKRYRYCKKNFA